MDKNKENRGRKRIYDAPKTRETILAAAGSAFAEHGFKGTSIDSIAAKAGYNKSLVFQYFGDKQRLYVEVLSQIDGEMSELLTGLFTSAIHDPPATYNKQWFKSFIRTLLESFIDFMIDHPYFMKLMNWEQAEGWSSLVQVSSKIEPTHFPQIKMLFRKAQEADLIRKDLDISFMLLLILQICWSAPSLFPLFKCIPVSGDQLFSDTLDNFREQTVRFIIDGIINIP
jgi:TetR/AcrR family transcriptional regulator